MSHPDHLLFLHIPKTAGSTMQSILEVNYRKKKRFVPQQMWKNNPNFHSLSDTQRSGIRLLMGHMPFGLHEKLGGGAFEYFTILRDPVDRIISLYYHILRHEHHPFHDELKAHDGSVSALLEKKLWPAFDNCQVRMLCGDLFLPYGEVTEKHLDLALQNIENHFPLVGLQSRFDELVLQLKDRYGWRFPYYRRFQVGRNRVGKAAPAEQDVETILRHNALDAKLLAAVKGRVEEELKKAGPEFAARVQRYKKRNKLFQKITDVIPIYKKQE